MAAKFKRDCYVLAFSGQSNLAEGDLKLSHDKDGLIRLLDFLAYTFRGGTDVEAPLKRAMELMLQAEWAAADVVLVTDGELMMPPLEKSAMEHLEQLKKEKQLRVHGLLVGQQSSLPLDLLCSNGDAENRVHTFLNDYETTFYSSAASASPFSKSPNRASASASILSDKDRSSRGRGVPGRGRLGMRLFSVSDTSGADVLEVGGNDEDFVAKANQWAAQLREAVKAKILSEASSSPSSLSEEYDKRAVDRRLLLQRAINALERGLIERSVEVRLLILAVLSGEHVLLLGPPGRIHADHSALSKRAL